MWIACSSTTSSDAVGWERRSIGRSSATRTSKRAARTSADVIYTVDIFAISQRRGVSVLRTYTDAWDVTAATDIKSDIRDFSHGILPSDCAKCGLGEFGYFGGVAPLSMTVEAVGRPSGPGAASTTTPAPTASFVSVGAMAVTVTPGGTTIVRVPPRYWIV
jgi:hypothetical protein